ncbi:MAG: glycosyltransferase [Anaerolineales bacterium]|nr:glycosyltransferase [Anaerolineales bacterium]
MDTYKFADKHLSQFDAVAVINIQLLSMLYDLHPHVFLCPDGINTKMFDRTDVRSGPMVVGWAGNTNDSIKQLPLLQKACEGICELRIASGDLDVNAMVRFYNTIDVIVCCSETEGGPRTLAEGMSCGNFPVSFNVGIAPEIIEHETNGLLVEEKSIEGLRSALLWCQNNIASVRGHWRVNREYIRSQRDKCHTTKQMAHMYQHVLSST